MQKMSFINSDIESYTEAHSTQESPILQRLNRETHAKILRPRMLSGHMQGKLLEMISQMLQPECVLEIGTYTGYSAICLAVGLKPGGKLITIDHNPELEDFTRSFFEEANIAHKVNYIIGEALDVLRGIEASPDLVFIDADKDNYHNYYEMVLPKMPSGGVILADNVLWSGKVLSEKAAKGDPEALALIEFNRYVHNDSRVENLMLPFRDGLSIIRKI